MNFKRYSIELMTLGYAMAYLPYVVLTRKMATLDTDVFGRPLSGLEILPGMLIAAMIFTFLFIRLTGWGKNVVRVKVGPFRIPFADKWTFWAGISSTVILVAVPLSYTMENVSIPFMQLLMRGDLLIIAPIVDMLSGRKVHWWSWTALVLVAIGLFVTLFDRGGLNLPLMAIVIVVLYTAAYFGRLYVMSKVSKNDDEIMRQRVYSEEKIVSFPLAIVVLAALPFLMGGSGSALLEWGFLDVWSSEQLPYILFCGLMVCITGIFATFILLNPRENSYCVPLERSASILAGIFGSVILAVFFGSKMPSGAEFFGAGLLIVAMVVLSVGPRLAAKK